MATLLRRMTTDELQQAASVSVDERRAQIAKEAVAVLGYRLLAKSVDAVVARRDACAALARANVVPFDPVSVSAYKKAKADKLCADEPAKKGMRVEVEWRRRGLIQREPCRAGYAYADSLAMMPTDHQVPLFALETAIRVKRELPEAELYVEELDRSEYDPNPKPDPLLVMEYGGHRFFLECWDEPGFDQKRLVPS